MTTGAAEEVVLAAVDAVFVVLEAAGCPPAMTLPSSAAALAEVDVALGASAAGGVLVVVGATYVEVEVELEVVEVLVAAASGELMLGVVAATGLLVVPRARQAEPLAPRRTKEPGVFPRFSSCAPTAAAACCRLAMWR